MATILKFTTINVAGMNAPAKRAHIFKHLIQEGHDVIALQETHCTNQTLEAWEKEWPGISKWNTHTSKSAGVAILFHPKSDVEILDTQMDFNGRVLQLTVKMQNYTFQILNLYAPNPERQDFSESFMDNVQYHLDPTLPALICGDFNMVEDFTKDRRGGKPRLYHTYGKEALKSLKQEFSLVDIWREKHSNTEQYTWNSRFENISSRLDRIYIPSVWSPGVEKVYIHPFAWSDHDMCTMAFFLPQQAKRGRGIWKMNLSHIESEAFQKEITSFWKDWKNQKTNYFDLGLWWDLGKTFIKKIAVDFSIRKQRENVSERRTVTDNLKNERKKLHPNREKIENLNRKLLEIDIEKQRKIFISAHNEVIEPGERPSKYFFGQLRSKQMRNGMASLKNSEGELLTDQRDVLRETVNYYTNLYTADENLDRDEQKKFLNNVHRSLSEKDREELESEITEKELQEALEQTENEKTPGCDGIPYEFYKKFWNLIGEDMHSAMMHNLKENKALSVSQRTSIIALLYKRDDKQLLKNWRPISLLCTDYKILSKALANRMKSKLHLLLNPEQTCSVPERTIFQNLFLTRDIIIYCNQKHMNGYILTIDQEKAFDRVDRNFLFEVMKKMNFGSKILSWINSIYFDTQSSTQINGHISVRFPITRGVRQGCPLSAILYSLLAETLGEEIRNSKKLHGIVLPGNKEIKITQYADDTTIYLSEKTQLKHFFEILKRFEKATGSKVNEDKTKGIRLGNSRHTDECHPKIKWKNEKGIKILGVKFFPDDLQTTNYNWSKRVEELQNFVEVKFYC